VLASLRDKDQWYLSSCRPWILTSPPSPLLSTTGGMGEEWAKQLAALGFNIILQGRNRSKLETVQSAIAVATPSAQTRLLVTEATIYPNEHLTRELTSLLSDPEVRLTVVINNLGTANAHFPLLEEETSETIAQVIISNTIFPAEVSRICLPHLKQHEPSLLAVVSSIGVWATPPYVAPYIGTKGFDLGFCQSLYNEMIAENRQVHVTCLVPGQVISGMLDAPESLMIPTSEGWTRAAIQSLAPSMWNLWSAKPGVCIVPHRWQYWATVITGILPAGVTRRLAIGIARGLKEGAAKNK
jgi:17beta-estradiol 17-dehydrogenase / very-long-chain 3-oxoacyl-CoA reductase